MESLVKVKGLKKQIKSKTILEDISFDIYKGDCVALIGPNGAGKTTLMDVLIGEKFPTKGEVEVLGRRPGEVKLKEKVAVLAQINAVPKRIKVKELIDFFRNIYQDSLSIEEINEYLRFTDDQKNQFADKLSGGQRRLLMFILTLVGKPEFLILDEPTAGMDTSTRQRFWEIVEKLKNDGVTILYSSHYIEEVEHTAERIFVLDKGHLLKDTTAHAMRAEEPEKYFTLPTKLKSAVEKIPNVYDLKIQRDCIEFTTKDGEKVWKILQENGATFKDLEVSNRTLLTSLFMSTGKYDERESDDGTAKKRRKK